MINKIVQRIVRRELSDYFTNEIFCFKKESTVKLPKKPSITFYFKKLIFKSNKNVS